MAFDPGAWLKTNQGAPAAAPAGGFDPQGWLEKNQQPGPWRSGLQTEQASVPRLPAPEDLPQPEKPGAVESFARGAASGGTAGFFDEIMGTLGAYGINVASVSGGGGHALAHAAVERQAAGDPAGMKTYRGIRDEVRTDQKTAREANPVAFGAGELTGSMVAPGPKGVLANAGLGGAYAVGQSEGGTLAEVALDAAEGAGAALAVGGALKGAGALTKKVIGGAPARVEGRAVNKLLEGTPAKTVQDPAIAKLGGKTGLARALKEEGLGKLLGGEARKIDDAVAERLDDVGGRLGQIYERVGKVDPGVPPEAVYQRLMALADRKKTDPEAADVIRNYAGKLREAFNEQGAMSAQDLHEVTKVLGRKGFAANVLDPSSASVIRREMRREVTGILQQHVDDVAKTNPGVGSLAELRQLNERYGKLATIADVAEAKATRDERYSPTLGQRMVQGVKMATNIGAAGTLAAAAMEGNMGLAAAGAGAVLAAKAAPHVVAAADRLAAGISDSRIANYLRGSQTVDELLTRAARIGIPREAAMQAVQQFGAQPAPAAPAAPESQPPLLSGT